MQFSEQTKIEYLSFSLKWSRTSASPLTVIYPLLSATSLKVFLFSSFVPPSSTKSNGFFSRATTIMLLHFPGAMTRLVTLIFALPYHSDNDTLLVFLLLEFLCVFLCMLLFLFLPSL